MDIDQLLSTFEQRLRGQHYRDAAIRNYKSAVGNFLRSASEKYRKPEELTVGRIEEYLYGLVKTKNISASCQRSMVASINKFYTLVFNLPLPVKHLYPTRKEYPYLHFT